MLCVSCHSPPFCVWVSEPRRGLWHPPLQGSVRGSIHSALQNSSRKEEVCENQSPTGIHRCKMRFTDVAGGAQRSPEDYVRPETRKLGEKHLRFRQWRCHQSGMQTGWRLCVWPGSSDLAPSGTKRDHQL